MSLVVETSGLRREFRNRRGRRRVAVDNLDLRIEQGGVHGFLGPNGSGKTTTIRMLLGLAKPTSGTMQLFGERVPRRLARVLDRVGAVVESPKFSPNFTARQNLRLLARSRGYPADRVDEALHRVSLSGRDRERYKTYSLGMKQRLAIAATLIKRPDLLILDEPTNGLDPAGIREIREMIRALADSGVTVLLSSHLLSEVQQVCDGATIIGNGRVLARGSVRELTAGTGAYLVRVDSADAGLQALQAAGLAAVLTDLTPPDAIRANLPLLKVTADDPRRITQVLAHSSIWVSELRPMDSDLESVFLRLTEGQQLGGSQEEAS